MALGWPYYKPKHAIREGDNTTMYPYKEARLMDAGGDPVKIWYIIYYAWNVDTETLDRKRVILSGTPDERYKEARDLIKQINAELKAGAFITRKKQPIVEEEQPAQAKRLNPDMPLLDACAYYIEQKTAALSDTTMKGYRGMMKRFLKFCETKRWHRIALRRFDVAMTYEFFDQLAADPDIENKTYNNYIGLVGGLFNFYLKRDIIKKNPCVSLDKLPVESGGHVPFTTEQARQLKEIMVEQDPQLWLLCSFMYYTFCRPGKELRYLRVRDIMADRIRIDRQHSKSNKTKWVLIPAGLERIIHEHNLRAFHPNYYVFGPSGHPGSTPVGSVYFWRHHRKVLEQIGLTDLEYDLYSWKHTGNIAAYLAGADLMYLRDQNGHHSVSQTEKYLKDLGMIRVKSHTDPHPEL